MASRWSLASPVNYQFTRSTLAINSLAYGARSYAEKLPSHTKLGLPALSPTMSQGNIISWKKKEGDKVKAGESIAEVETDKAVMSWDSADDGYIAKILVPAGTKDLPVGQIVAVIVEDEADVAAFKDFSAAAAAAPAAPKAAAAAAPAAATPAAAAPKAAAPSAASGVPPPPGGRVKASPAARFVAADRGVDLTQGPGTGPQGRIVKQDVISFGGAVAAVPAGSPVTAGGAAYTDIDNSQIRKITASRLTQSKQTIPHYYLTIDFSVDELLRVRNTLNQAANGQYKLSVNDFVVKAAALALRQVPEVNSAWNETSIRRFHNVNINVAVNTDRGLFTPLISQTDNKGLVEINKQTKELAEKAKAGKLGATELETGTFTISNLGMFGIKHFAAVINPPQACILAVGGVEERVVSNKNAKEGEDKFKVSQYMAVTLSCDHRVVDGALGAQWLNAFRKNIENPLNMLL